MSAVSLQHKLRLAGHTCFAALSASLDWGHVNLEEETISNLSEDILTYLNQVRHAIKSRQSSDARRASANAYLKMVIQALQDYTLTISTGRNAALHAKTQDTELIVHAQLNADIR